MTTQTSTQTSTTLWFEDPAAKALALCGGKNASLAEMTQTMKQLGVDVPPGFAVTVRGYHALLDENDLRAPITRELEAMRLGKQGLQKTGSAIRRMLHGARIPESVVKDVTAAYAELCRREGNPDLAVAVRSSATAEDLPEASFAGQQESYLNIHGTAELLDAVRKCFASLFTDRAIAYREEHKFEHMKVALSVGVQKMVRSDLAAAGVMFTVDTETGFPRAVLVTSSYGLGENVVKGSVNPDEMLVFKPLLVDETKRPLLRKRLGEKERTMVLARGGSATTRNVDTPAEKRARFSITDEEVLRLARWAVAIETRTSERLGHAVPMDIEWAKDGDNGKLYIVQARPETVQSQRAASGLVQWTLDGKGKALVAGRAVGDAIASAPVCIIKSVVDIERFTAGSILVAEMTDPDWVPAMRKAAGIITEHGGRTCHAAIVARELGIPAVVGAEGATSVLKEGDVVTLVCAGGEEGRVLEGAVTFHKEDIALDAVPTTKTKVMINLADPASALKWWKLPADGVGLARMEFIIADDVRVHPMALAHFERVTDPKDRADIEALTRGYADKSSFFVDKLARGIAMLAAAQHPNPVIVRMSDFKTNEYAGLLGGKPFEPVEENPMIGFRGASRYYSDRYRDGFALECRAIKAVREDMGLDNVIVMIPFCRTLEEADRVLEVMADHGLARGKHGLKVYVMCEIPSNVILAEEFAKRFDGFSIGSNDLTQLTLGVDRDSEILAPLFDERNPAVKQLIVDVIRRAHGAGRPVGICGQAPSDHPEFAAFLVEHDIDSISLNPDRFLKTKLKIAEAEAKRARP
jgi:pyruvate, water dikinase